MEKGLQTMFATILGAILLLVGIIGFVNNPVLGIFPVNNLHNLVHIVSGVVLVWAGVWGGTTVARMVNRIFGIVYGLVAVLGFVAPGMMMNLLNVEMKDNILHILIAVASLIVGFSKRE